MLTLPMLTAVSLYLATGLVWTWAICPLLLYVGGKGSFYAGLRCDDWRDTLELYWYFSKLSALWPWLVYRYVGHLLREARG